nr:unnamed protein product [Callosobruchus analis]
MIPAAAAT